MSRTVAVEPGAGPGFCSDAGKQWENLRPGDGNPSRDEGLQREGVYETLFGEKSMLQKL